MKILRDILLYPFLFFALAIYLVLWLCQLYAFIVGGFTFFSAFKSIFFGFCAQHPVEIEPDFPLPLAEPLNNFLLLLGLMFASSKTGAKLGCFGTLLCFLNVILLLSTGAYFQYKEQVNLPGCWSGVLFIISRLVIGSTIASIVWAAWTKKGVRGTGTG